MESDTERPADPTARASTRRPIYPEIVDLTREESINISTRRRQMPTYQSNCEVITIDDSANSPEPPSKRRPRPYPRTPLSRPKTPPPPPGTPPVILKCPICIETFANVRKRGLKVVATRCGHLFCDFCLKKALSESGRKCPKCRKAVPKGVTGVFEIFDV